MEPYFSMLTLDRAVCKQNDTGPPMVVALEDSNGPMDLTAVTTVTLVLRGNSSNTLVTGTCATENQHGGQALYTWRSTDMDTPDTYQAEIELLKADGTRQTVPNDYANNPTLRIVQQLNPAADE